MPEKDYYKILGLEKNASDADIKKAYRKMAMKYHPDHAKGDKASEDKFKDVSEAYAVLSDKEKRKQYDTYGSTDFHQRYSQEDIFKGFDFGDIFKEFGFGGRNFSRGGRGGRGGFKFSFGGQDPFASYSAQQAPTRGNDLVYELPLTLREIATGARKTVQFQHKGRSENISVKIPRGMIDGKKLRIAGKGEVDPYGGSPGDLFIVAKIMSDPVFSPKGADLYATREIKLSEALLGTTLEIPKVEGGAVSLKIPPGTRHKTKMRLAGHGLPHMKGGGKGDVYISINVAIPKHLTQAQKALVKKLADVGL